MIWKNLSRVDVGIYSTAQSLIILISSIACLGFTSANAKLIPEYIETKKLGLIRSLIQFSSKLILIASVIAAIIVLLSAPLLTKFIADFPFSAVILVALGIIFLAFGNYLGYVLIGYQDMKKFFLTDLIGNIFKFVLALILIYLGFQYLGPISGLVLGFFVVIIVRLNFKWFKKDEGKLDKKFVLFNYSLPSLVASFGPIIFSNMPYIILAFISGLEVTGIFTTALSVTSQLTVLISILSNSIFPVISQISVYRNSKSKQNAIINLGVKYGLLFTLPVALVLMFASRAIVLLLAPSTYLPASNLFPILSVSFLISGLSGIFLSSLYAVRRPKTSRNIWIFSSLIFLLLSIPLTIYYSALGISFAYLISISILLILSVYYLRKYLKFSLNWIEILKMIVASFIFVLFIFLADFLSIPNLGKYLIGAIGVLLYFVLLMFMKFFTKIDVKILQILGDKIPLLKSAFNFLAKILSKYS